jgi:hypothetical protein
MPPMEVGTGWLTDRQKDIQGLPMGCQKNLGTNVPESLKSVQVNRR